MRYKNCGILRIHSRGTSPVQHLLKIHEEEKPEDSKWEPLMSLWDYGN
jgi:hypothetical protein